MDSELDFIEKNISILYEIAIKTLAASILNMLLKLFHENKISAETLFEMKQEIEVLVETTQIELEAQLQSDII